MFPVYTTRDEYKAAAGPEAPAWNTDRARKIWFDPDAKNATSMSVVYDSVIAATANGVPRTGKDGKPMTDLMVLSKSEAGSVNIPPIGTNVPGADVPVVQPPPRPLEHGEELWL